MPRPSYHLVAFFLHVSIKTFIKDTLKIVYDALMIHLLRHDNFNKAMKTSAAFNTLALSPDDRCMNNLPTTARSVDCLLLH